MKSHIKIVQFYVLLTVHLSIILIINKRNTQILVLEQVYSMPLHVSSTMCSSSGGQNVLYSTGPTGVMIPDAV